MTDLSLSAPGAPWHHAYTLSDFDFSLPPNSSHSTRPPSAAHRAARRPRHGARRPHLPELPGLLREGDLLVFNDTRVVKARIFGEKASGGKLELLIERVLKGNEVVAHMKVSKSPCPAAPCTWPAGASGRL
jgi:S-adenosylmethionine:tRNA ribosyltransferase-isomerase